MTTKKPKLDASQNAARVVKESTAKGETPLPADIEAAWSQWIAGVGKIDDRAKALLRASFEVGLNAGKKLKYLRKENEVKKR